MHVLIDIESIAVVGTFIWFMAELLFGNAKNPKGSRYMIASLMVLITSAVVLCTTSVIKTLLGM